MKRAEKLETACKEYEEDLVLYYYGENSAAERSRMSTHLKACSRCSLFLDDLTRLLPQMAQPNEPTESFWNDYYLEMVDKLDEYREQKPVWRNFFAPLRLWAVPAFGTLAVGIMAFVLVFGHGGWIFQPNKPQPKIPQEIMADAKKLEFFNSMDMLESLNVLEALDGTKIDLSRGQHSL